MDRNSTEAERNKAKESGKRLFRARGILLDVWKGIRGKICQKKWQISVQRWENLARSDASSSCDSCDLPPKGLQHNWFIQALASSPLTSSSLGFVRVGRLEIPAKHHSTALLLLVSGLEVPKTSIGSVEMLLQCPVKCPSTFSKHFPGPEQWFGSGTDHAWYLFSAALLPALRPSRSRCSAALAPTGVACHLVSAAAPTFCSCQLELVC